MPWKKSENLIMKRLNQHGLGAAVRAGIICIEAERLHPGLFRAVSVKNGCLHLELHRNNQVKLTLIQGKLLAELNILAKARSLPEITRIRLTFVTE